MTNTIKELYDQSGSKNTAVNNNLVNTKKIEKEYIEENERIRYQNALLISQLEQSEKGKKELMKEI